ncbi:hypothetical protein M0R89_15745 [Halorussus limi]|uniref:Uncharacterized protein n=1 Tax=Halorussus limi TaxID=2938695 RepID=A0A8U0HSY3_9EURY|nr:hypothetical protein [Halorussus limi]UPV73979.1 hypothetical protein M0R89_15745 [Halorussus limi]
MRSIEVLLFGIAVVCASGFFLVGQALGVVSESIVTWGLVFGLLLCFLGLLVDDPNSHGNGRRVRNESDGASGRGPDDTPGDENDSGDDETDGDDPDTNRYSVNRFPPM